MDVAAGLAISSSKREMHRDGDGEDAAARGGGREELTVAGGGEVKVLCERRRSVGAAK